MLLYGRLVHTRKEIVDIEEGETLAPLFFIDLDVCIPVFRLFQDTQLSPDPAGASLPSKTDGGVQKSRVEEKERKWAVPIDITSPCEDFYKRIPNPAFKVQILK